MSAFQITVIIINDKVLKLLCTFSQLILLYYIKKNLKKKPIHDSIILKIRFGNIEMNTKLF